MRRKLWGLSSNSRLRISASLMTGVVGFLIDEVIDGTAGGKLQPRVKVEGALATFAHPFISAELSMPSITTWGLKQLGSVNQAGSFRLKERTWALAVVGVSDVGWWVPSVVNAGAAISFWWGRIEVSGSLGERNLSRIQFLEGHIGGFSSLIRNTSRFWFISTGVVGV